MELNAISFGFTSSTEAVPTTVSPLHSSTVTVPTSLLLAAVNRPVVASIVPNAAEASATFHTRPSGRSAAPPLRSTPTALNCTEEPGVYSSSRGLITAWSNTPSCDSVEMQSIPELMVRS